MARKKEIRQLSVWMNGERVGIWLPGPGGNDEFCYDEKWLSSPRVRPLSLSLPLQEHTLPHKGSMVESYFDNLLPDSREMRERIRHRFRTGSTRPFDLLKEIGRDCVGALQFLPVDELPVGIRTLDYVELSDHEIAEIVRNRPFYRPFGTGEQDFRISIAGSQEKTALLQYEGKWCTPLGSTPTTHIVKLPLGQVAGGMVDLSTSVENEWLCARILEGFAIPVPPSEILEFEDQKVLVVRRFDRSFAPDSSWIIRIPQEDMCQAFGISPEYKYESEGGPGISRIMTLLLASKESRNDRTLFFKTMIVFWLLAAIDGHAKNFSIFLEAQGRFRLTPFYDVLSAYPVMGSSSSALSKEKIRMAMAVHGKNRHYRWSRILGRHWLEMGKRCGMEASEVRDIIQSVVDNVPGAIEYAAGELPSGFPEQVADSIFSGIRDGVGNLL